MTKNVKQRTGYHSVAVITSGLVVTPGAAERELERALCITTGAGVQVLETIVTAPDRDLSGVPIPGTGGRCDVFIAFRSKDMPALLKHRAHMPSCTTWLRDLLTEHPNRYPSRVRGYLRKEHSMAQRDPLSLTEAQCGAYLSNHRVTEDKRRLLRSRRKRVDSYTALGEAFTRAVRVQLPRIQLKLHIDLVDLEISWGIRKGGATHTVSVTVQQDLNRMLLRTLSDSVVLEESILRITELQDVVSLFVSAVQSVRESIKRRKV